MLGIVYVNPMLDLLETSFLANLSMLTYFTLYIRGNGGNQSILFYVSSSIALVTFLGILLYHICKYRIHCTEKRDGENRLALIGKEYDSIGKNKFFASRAHIIVVYSYCINIIAICVYHMHANQFMFE